MKKLNIIFLLTFYFFIFNLFGQITGIVFRDFNGDGIKQSGEPLVPNILVKAYAPNTIIPCSSTTTSSSSIPNYTLTGCTGNVRIEFEIPNSNTFPNGPLAGIDFSSFKGTNNSSSVQFVSSNQSGVDYAIFYPGNFSNQSVNNIKLTVPTYNSGDITNSGSNAYNDKAIITFPYLASGREDQANQSGTDNYTTATAGEIGSTWGLAYQKDQKRLFASSLLKRHVGLTSNGVGIIWKIDMSNPTNAGTPAVFYDFGTAAGSVGTNSSRDIPIDKTKNSVDVEAWSKAGKVGFGDIEISDDNQTLYVVNLFDRKVYKLDATGSAASFASPLPDYPDPGCTNGITRPWALKFWRGKLYLGVICDGSSGGNRSNLSAFVFEFNPSLNSWNLTPIITFPLDYNKGSARTGADAPFWSPWTDNLVDFQYQGGCFFCSLIHPQPILSDIEFDEEGSMHLALLDRAGFQIGHRNALPIATPANKELDTNNGNGTSSGDILRTYLNPATGLYELEEDGKAGTYTSSGTGTGITGIGGVNSLQGPSKNNPGEFYWDDQVNNGWHSEISVGGLVYVPGQKEIVLSVFDPITLDAGGIESFSIVDGSSTRRYQTYFGDAIDEGGPGKANGMGDIEILGDLPPIEIGNRVWMDTDYDGVQDADEMGLDGITVKLFNGSSLVASKTTANGGQYYFNTADGVLPNTTYTIRIEGSNFPSGKNVTLKDQTTGGIQDFGDNDASSVGGNADITYTTGNPGENNHTLDFGFSSAPTCSISATCSATPQSNCSPINGSASVVVSGAQGNVSFKWSSGETTATISNKSAGTYTVTVTDDFVAGCNTTCQAIIANITLPPSVNCSKLDNSNCTTPNGTATATASGVTYLWSNGGTTATISGLNAGTYTVTVTSTTNICTSTCSATIQNTTSPPSITCTPTQPTCLTQNGGSVSTSVIGGTIPLTYIWSNGATASTISNLEAGTYTVTVKDNNNCAASCSAVLNAPIGCCEIINLNLLIGNCNNKGTLTNANDDEYTFTLNPTGTGIGTTYIVNGLPNSPQTGIYGNPTTFGPYLISAGVLNITVVDNVASTCTKTASVSPPPSCSVCNVTPPVLTVNDNVCPSRTGTINLIQGCGAGTFIQYSINNGTTWSSVKPLYSTTPRTILARCVNSIDTLCKSTNTSVTTDPKKCTFSGNECTLIANATIDPCNNNGTGDNKADDYFTIQINATVANGGSSNKYEVVIGADPLTGIGGNVLNSGGTNYGSPVTVGNTKVFVADKTSIYQLVVRDINNNNCYQIIDIDPVAPCSLAPPKSPCYPVPCVPIQLIKN